MENLPEIIADETEELGSAAADDILLEDLVDEAGDDSTAVEDEVAMLDLLRGLHERLASVRAGATCEVIHGGTDTAQCPRFHGDGRKVLQSASLSYRI